MQKIGEKIGKQKLGIQDKKILNKNYQKNKSEKIKKISSLIKKIEQRKKTIEKGVCGQEEIWLW